MSCAGLHTRWIAAALAAVGVIGGSPLEAAVTAEQVRTAIERGSAFLLREQGNDGSWPDPPAYAGGITALCTLALLNAGVPPNDPAIERALEYLRKLPPRRTYPTALQTMVFCEASPERDRLLIRRNVEWFIEQQVLNSQMRGSWGYPDGAGDNSNAQFALLALHEAQRVGVEVSPQTWRLALEYWRGTQNPDGSWGYKPTFPGSGSMTAAGIGSMVIALDKLGQGDARVEGERIRCCVEQEHDPTIEKALAWMGRNFSVSTNPGVSGSNGYLLYYLYALERVGRMTNRRFLGDHDWYREGAEYLVNTQEDLSGFWKGIGIVEENTYVSTSFALLFLSKGRRPILAAKLKHLPEGDWDRHRRDLDNLTVYVEQKWDQPLTWQVIDVAAASTDDLLEAPVLYLSGRFDPEVSDEEVTHLRQFVDRGGFIYADASCGGQDFDEGFRKLVERIFPEPEYRLHLLPPEHPIWSAEEPVDPNYVKPLWGIDIGCRTSVVYCPDDLSCLWELARPGRKQEHPQNVKDEIQAGLAMGINIMAYATNREPKYKLETPKLVDDLAKDQFERAKIYVPKLRHSGAWNAAPNALRNLMVAAAREARFRASSEQRELDPLDQRVFDYPLIFMHGRNAFQFTGEERLRIREFVERGGTLFADAICASEAFNASFRKEMAEIFPDQPLARIPLDSPMFTKEFGGFDLKTVSRRDPQRRAEGDPLKAVVRQVEPELLGVKITDRYGVIFSPYDLSCALERHASLECAGYTPEDAARIGTNVILYALMQ